MRFRLALEELGGLYRTFGRFLAGRADLLPSFYLSELLKIPPAARPILCDVVRTELGGRVQNLEPLRAGSCFESFRGNYQGQRVVVEIFEKTGKDFFKEESWKQFCAGIRLLVDDAEHLLGRSSVQEEFQQWLLLQSDIERKRGILKNLQAAPSGCVSRLPRLIPELQSGNALVYEWREGRPLSLEIGRRDSAVRRSLQLFVECFLEQALFLSFVPSDFDPRNLLLTPDQGIAYQVFPAVAAVPAEFNYELLQYTASSVAGETARAIRMLSRIMKGQSERLLWQEFSGLQPMLKIGAMTPESVIALENYWRAAAGTGIRAPLFLQLFHRLVTIFGHYNGDVVPSMDLVSESLWPVMGRILRFRLSELASVEKAREWMMGTGLLFFETTRQMGLTLEQLRDNDLSLTVDTTEARPQEPKRRGRTMNLVTCLLVFAVFLAALQVSLRSPSPAVQISASVLAAISGIILFILIARIN